MRPCEKCGTEHDGRYASGRFCGSRCSRSFATSKAREEINKKVAETLASKTVFFEKTCPVCSSLFRVTKRKIGKQSCSVKCGRKLSNSRPEVREKLSIARTQAIIDGKTNFKSIRCTYIFNDSPIRCDSKIEYACLHYFETVHNAISMKRCNESIEFDDNGQKRRFIPDFIIETVEDCFIVECKSFASVKSLNEKWRKYNELSILKREVLNKFAAETHRKPFWFTKDLHAAYYNNVKPIAR
jgi:predicted Zn finger-like uncharacterized protein